MGQYKMGRISSDSEFESRADMENPPVRPTRLEIDLSVIRHNLKEVRNLCSSPRVMGIVKANAYGHGLTTVAHCLEDAGIDCLGVAILEEGIQLRKAGIRLPILVMGGVITNQIPYYLRWDLMPTAPSVEKLELINEAAQASRKRAKVHLKIDTGMERIGTHWYSAEKLLEASLRYSQVEVDGIYTHFANADDPANPQSALQIERFLETIEFYTHRGLPNPTRHLANSAGILHFPESHLDMVRPGMVLYGYYPSEKSMRSLEIQPAMSWKTCVNYFKVVNADSPVSYGSTWKSDKPVRMVTIPVGYGDGYSLALSNKAEVLIRGQAFPVVGKVCMDQSMINVMDQSAYNGDEVVLLGTQGRCSVTIEKLAHWAGTSHYEILANMSSRLPRIYHNG